jgi:hypothetical protein
MMGAVRTLQGVQPDARHADDAENQHQGPESHAH